MIPEPKYDGAYGAAGKFMFRDGTSTNTQDFNNNNPNKNNGMLSPIFDTLVLPIFKPFGIPIF